MATPQIITSACTLTSKGRPMPLPFNHNTVSNSNSFKADNPLTTVMSRHSQTKLALERIMAVTTGQTIRCTRTLMRSILELKWPLLCEDLNLSLNNSSRDSTKEMSSFKTTIRTSKPNPNNSNSPPKAISILKGRLNLIRL